jgi:hypothetical protein
MHTAAMDVLLLSWPVWVAWSCAIVWLTKVMLASLFWQFLERRTSYILAYTLLLLFPLAGLAMIDVSGMKIYGFDRNDTGQWFGYFTLVFSPFGIPWAMGLPVVLLIDLFRRPWRVQTEQLD